MDFRSNVAPGKINRNEAARVQRNTGLGRDVLFGLPTPAAVILGQHGIHAFDVYSLITCDN